MVPPVSHHSKRSPVLEMKRKWSRNQSEHGHAPWDEPGAVHQVAEDQPVADRNGEPWTEEKRPVLEGGERDGEIGRVRSVLAQADDPEDEDHPSREGRRSR